MGVTPKTSRKNFPSWKKSRQEVALANWEERLKLSDEKLFETSKKFRVGDFNLGDGRTKKALDNHRKWIKGQISILQEKLKAHR